MIGSTDPDIHNQEIAERVLTLTGEFMRFIAANPTVAPTVPDGATVILLPDNDPDVAAYNMRLGMNAVAAGENVYFLHVEMTGTHLRVPAEQRTA